MTTSCFVKRVEWTTELPFRDTPRVSPEISVNGSEYFLYLRYFDTERYKLTMHETKDKLVLPSKDFQVTTFIQQPYTNRPILTAISFKSSNCLWARTRGQILKSLPNIVSSNKFTIICLFDYPEPCVEQANVSTQTTWTAHVDLQSLSRNFSTFLKNESFADAELKCADRIFSAHRLILASRSEVFRNRKVDIEAGMFDINDVDPEVLELLLQYMYLGERLDLCEETAQSLYKAADKYAVHDLRRACSDWMVRYQTSENCLDLLVLAHEHSDENFKKEVVRFVAEHLAELRLESWLELKERYPLLVLSVLEKCMEVSLPGVAKVDKDSDTSNSVDNLSESSV